jgi:hypothetical protein
MDIRALRGRHARLQAELSRVVSEQPFPAGRIERLTSEIATTERAIDSLVEPPEGSARGDVPGSTAGAHADLARRTPAPVRMARPTPFGRRLQATAVG